MSEKRMDWHSTPTRDEGKNGTEVSSRSGSGPDKRGLHLVVCQELPHPSAGFALLFFTKWKSFPQVSSGDSRMRHLMKVLNTGTAEWILFFLSLKHGEGANY